MKRDRISFKVLVALLGLALTAGCLDIGSDSSGEGQVMTVAEVAEQDADGVAVHLDETVTTEGVVTVSTGVLANKKLKVFIQGSPEGVMVFHENGAAEIPPGDFEVGDWVRVTGVVSQTDLTGDNKATGTVRVDISAGSWEVLSKGNELPLPQPVTLADLVADGNAYEGSLVYVPDVYISGGWYRTPVAGGQTTWVTVSDGTDLTMRLEKNTISVEMEDKLADIGLDIGDGPFHLIGIVVQNDTNDDGDLLDEFQIWPRGASDFIASEADGTLAELGAEDANGTALLLGETVTAEGIVTVANGVLFDQKFEVFIQDSTAGLMLLSESPPAGLAVAPGDLVRVTGTIAQTASLDGTVRISFSGALEVLRSGLGVPSPQVVTIAGYLADSGAYEGELIRINSVYKSSGAWPAVGTEGSVYITDSAAVPIKLQIQKNANTANLTGTPNPFDVVGIAVQNGASWEVWIRSADDIITP